MNKILAVSIILACLLFSVLIPVSINAEEEPWWNDFFSFKEKIEIPIDTNDSYSKYQPIDISINFENLCWAKNEDEHSVRVVFQDGIKFIELESQIYDLKFEDNEHISSCNLVFLIPKEANGNESYFVYYDDSKKQGPDYEKRVKLDEDYYYYEPIQGLFFETSFFKIMQNDEIIFAANKEGNVLNSPVSQQVTILKKGAEEIKPYNGEHLASFGFNYWWKTNKWNLISASEKFVSKDTIVDGNLMVKFKIVSESNDGSIRSSIIYKYYFSPTEERRLYLHARHEVLKTLPTGNELDVGFVIAHSGGIKSSTHKELNFGEIPPYLHFYSKEEIIKSEKVPQYPESPKWETIIPKQYDYDLGSIPWASLDYGETGKAFAIIFASNKIVKRGENEKEGLELQLIQSNYLNLPGLIGRVSDLYITRNDYERGEPLDLELPSNYIAEFHAQYFMTENGGFKTVDKEARIFQKLISFQPEIDDNTTGTKDDIAKYNLTASVHFAPSFPMGSLLSAVLGKNVSYIYAELYKENSFRSSGSVGRLPLLNIFDFNIEGKNLFEKIKALLGIFDWRNVSFFKKIVFTGQTAGTYLLKIFRENPLLKEGREFIGYEIIDLNDDKNIRIFCKPEGKVSISAKDQNNNGIKNIDVSFIDNDIVISSGKTDENGKAVITAPVSLFEKYNLNVTYQGFLISNEYIRLGRIRALLPLNKKYNFDVDDLTIKIKDDQGKTPVFNFDYSLTSSDMDYPIIIKPDSILDGTCKFDNLYYADYILTIKYNSFEVKEEIKIPDTSLYEINLRELKVLIKDTWGLPPGTSLAVSLESLDFEKKVILQADEISFEEYKFSNIYPGNYNIKVRYKTFSIEKEISIPTDKNILTEIDFPAELDVKLVILDARGNALKDAVVKFDRDGLEISKVTNENGAISLIIPPGNYVITIYSEESLIAQRKLDVFNERNLDISTKKEPVAPFVIITIAFVLGLISLFLCHRKKDIRLFLKILAVLIAVVAIVSPWWVLSGCSDNSHFENTTKLYITPTKMVSFTENINVSAGEIFSLDERFVSVIDLLPIAISLGLICIIASIILSKFNKVKLSFLAKILCIIILIGSAVLFYYAMSILSDITVGSIFGSGDIKISIPGENLHQTLFCNWGLSTGFCLLCFSISLVIIELVLYLKRKK
jgi:hypothetical protein